VRQPLLQAFPFPSTLGEVALHPPFPAGLFIYSSVRDSPPPFSAQGALPSLLRVFCCCCLIFSLVFSLFSLGWGQSVQRAMLICPRVVCGSTVWHLAHLVVCFFRAGRSWRLAAWEPSWFLRLTWSGDAIHRQGVWRSQSFASSWWFFLQSVSPASLQDFILGSMISASSL
jgi:hypothetical protein